MKAKPRPARARTVSSLPGPQDILRQEWSSGEVFLARENPTSPSAVFQGLLPAHGLDEDRTHAGLAGLAASALLRGTERRSFAEIYEAIESVGAGLSIHGGKTHTAFHGKCLVEDLPLILGLLADALRSPTFPIEAVDQLKAERLTALAIRDQDTASVADMTFDALAYPHHPYGLAGDGYRDSISGLESADLRDFHQRSFGPRGLILAVVGGLDTHAAAEIAARSLAGWPTSAGVAWPAVPEAAAPSGLLRQSVTLPEKAQTDLVMGSPGPSRFAPDYLAAALANNILGVFGMMGRIGETVREKAGMAYYAYTQLEGGPGPGAWKAVAGVDPGNLERAVEMIRQEIRALRQRGVTRQELADSQTQFVGRLPLQLETNEGVASALVHLERYQLGLDFYPRYPEMIRGITREQVVLASRRYLDPDRLAVGIAGPPAEGKAA